MDTIESLKQERDEADRRAGAAERSLEYYKESEFRHASWNDKAKEQWGVHRNVSFDVVWDEALKAKQERDQLRVDLAAAQERERVLLEKNAALRTTVGRLGSSVVEETLEFYDKMIADNVDPAQLADLKEMLTRFAQLAMKPTTNAALAQSEPTATQGVSENGTEHCPECGAKEVPANTPRTVYACGSSDYDQRPGSFLRGEGCEPTAQPAVETQTDGELLASIADDIRAQGWAVAVHNDYRMRELPHTFWLFTKDGQCVKGEGRTDAEALTEVRNAIASEGRA